jgi:hypothetical protein
VLIGLVLAAVCLGYLPLVEGVAAAVILSEPLMAVPAVGLAMIRSRKQANRMSHPELVASLIRSVSACLL